MADQCHTYDTYSMRFSSSICSPSCQLCIVLRAMHQLGHLFTARLCAAHTNTPAKCKAPRRGQVSARLTPPVPGVQAPAGSGCRVALAAAFALCGKATLAGRGVLPLSATRNSAGSGLLLKGWPQQALQRGREDLVDQRQGLVVVPEEVLAPPEGALLSKLPAHRFVLVTLLACVKRAVCCQLHGPRGGQDVSASSMPGKETLCHSHILRVFCGRGLRHPGSREYTVYGIRVMQGLTLYLCWSGL